MSGLNGLLTGPERDLFIASCVGTASDEKITELAKIFSEIASYHEYTNGETVAAAFWLIEKLGQKAIADIAGLLKPTA